MKRFGEIMNTRRWEKGRAPERPEPGVAREAPAAPENDTFEDEIYADVTIAKYHSMFSKTGLPDPRSPEGLEEYAFWVKQFAAKGIRTSDVLRAGEEIKAGMPDVFPNQHLATIIRLAGGYALEREQATATYRRQHADRLAADADAPRLARWEALDPDRRNAIRRRVLADHPDLARWEKVTLGICLDRMEAAEAPAEATR